METFPRKPFYDRVIVREIPVEEYYQQPENIAIDLTNANIKIRSDRGIVVAAGSKVEEAIVGDMVFFDEFSQCDPIYLNPGDALKTDLPKYWQIREADLKGFDVARREEISQLNCDDKCLSCGLALWKHENGVAGETWSHFPNHFDHDPRPESVCA